VNDAEAVLRISDADMARLVDAGLFDADDLDGDDIAELEEDEDGELLGNSPPDE